MTYEMTAKQMQEMIDGASQSIKEARMISLIIERVNRSVLGISGSVDTAFLYESIDHEVEQWKHAEVRLSTLRRILEQDDDALVADVVRLMAKFSRSPEGIEAVARLEERKAR